MQEYSPDLLSTNILTLAGDTSTGLKGLLWAVDLLKTYPELHIIYVLGNHCQWRTNQTKSIESCIRKHKEFSDKHERLHFLENDSVVINDIRFIGACLWSDYNRNNPSSIYLAEQAMNDYKYIRHNNGLSRFTPYKAMQLHKESKKYIFDTLNNSKEKCIVITHMKPYASSTDYLSGAYESELRNELVDCINPPIIWQYGHTHKYDDTTFDFPNGSTRFLSNCYGYPFENRTGFNKDLIIEI